MAHLGPLLPSPVTYSSYLSSTPGTDTGFSLPCPLLAIQRAVILHVLCARVRESVLSESSQGTQLTLTRQGLQTRLLLQQSALNLSRLSFRGAFADHPHTPGPVPGFGDGNDGKTGPCCPGARGGLFSASNHINKPVPAHRWVLINFPLEIICVFWEPCNSGECSGRILG